MLNDPAVKPTFAPVPARAARPLEERVAELERTLARDLRVPVLFEDLRPLPTAGELELPTFDELLYAAAWMLAVAAFVLMVKAGGA